MNEEKGIIQDALEETPNMPSGPWKFIAVAAISFIIGSGIPLFMTRDYVSRSDLQAARIDQQKNTDGLSLQISALSQQVAAMNVTIGTMEQWMKDQDDENLRREKRQ